MNFVDSLYIHFPHCKHLCNYCDFYKTLLNKRSDLFSLHNLLMLQIEKHQELMNENGAGWDKLKTIYIGGGTPSLWGIEGINFLKKFFSENKITFSQKYEFTLEANPAFLELDLLEEWFSLGVNRISLGVQCLDANLQGFLDRAHSVEESLTFLEKIKTYKVNKTFDLMLGLPFSEEKKRDITREIEQILMYEPNHLSVYILTVPESYKYFKNLPSEEYIESEYLRVSEFLQKRGFEHYEVSNFALPGFASRHNLRYWAGDSVAALGPSATGFLRLEENKAIRYKWKTNNPEYNLEILGANELITEDIYLSLRLNLGGSNIFHSMDKYIDQKRIIGLKEKWLASGFLRADEKGLNAKGYLLLDSLAAEALDLASKNNRL